MPRSGDCAWLLSANWGDDKRHSKDGTPFRELSESGHALRPVDGLHESSLEIGM